MMMLKRLTNYLLNKFNLDIVRKERINQIDLKNITYFRGLIYNDFYKPFITFAYISDIRALPSFSFNLSDIHPFVISSKLLIKEDFKNKEKTIAILREFYKIYQPSSAADILNIQNDKLRNEPSWATLLPWEQEDLETWKTHVKNSVLNENKRNKSNIDIEDGWAWSGPISEIKLMVEFNRLLKVVKSISKRGYNSKYHQDDYIVTYLLVNKHNQATHLARTGQHRLAALGALGYDKVKVKVFKIVYQEDAKYWPNVVNGLFSLDEANKVFSKYFNNDLSSTANAWMQYCKSLDI